MNIEKCPNCDGETFKVQLIWSGALMIGVVIECTACQYIETFYYDTEI